MVVVSAGLSNPRSLALYPAKGQMFVADWGGNPKIVRYSMDGSSKKVLFTNRGWPSGLTIDYDRDLIYWVDYRGHKLYKMDIDGGKWKQPFTTSGICKIVCDCKLLLMHDFACILNSGLINYR